MGFQDPVITEWSLNHIGFSSSFMVYSFIKGCWKLWADSRRNFGVLEGTSHAGGEPTATATANRARAPSSVSGAWSRTLAVIVCPEPQGDLRRFECSYGVDYGTLRWIYFLDPSRGLGGASAEAVSQG